MAKEIETLYEDADLIALSKPAGLLTVRGRWDPDERTILDILESRDPGVDFRLVHRLDKGTSGVLVLAKSLDAQRSLSQQWRDRVVRKVYLALVAGSPEEDEFTIDLPIEAAPHRRKVVAGRSRGSKPALTECRVVERFVGYALVEARPVTGRQHQVRAHLQAVGLPLAVDPLYGCPRPVLLSELKPRYKRKDREAPLIARTSLHALRLEINHPRTGERLSFEAPLPKDFALTLKNLRRYKAIARPQTAHAAEPTAGSPSPPFPPGASSES